MFYKVIYNEKIIDALDSLDFVRYQDKHDLLLLCPQNKAGGILSSNRKTAYNCSLCPYQLPEKYTMVNLEPITEMEFISLKERHFMTYDEIIDSYTEQLLEGGIL